MDTNLHYLGLYSASEIGSNNFSIWQERTYFDLLNEDLEGKKIMEVGVGHHGILFSLKKQFPQNEYIGVDLSHDVLSYLSNNNFTSHKADIGVEEIPLPNESIDIIIFNEVIEHIFDCQHALDELYRVLKKDGKLYISTHNTFNIIMRFKYLFGFIPNGSLDVTDIHSRGEHIRIFNQEIFLTLIRRAGFEKLENKSWTGIFRNFFLTGPFTALFARHFYYICTK